MSWQEKLVLCFWTVPICWYFTEISKVRLSIKILYVIYTGI
jgi:hypothetical protein